MPRIIITKRDLLVKRFSDTLREITEDDLRSVFSPTTCSSRAKLLEQLASIEGYADGVVCHDLYAATIAAVESDRDANS